MNRESNLDLLRVFCCIAVIVEHACGVFINEAKLVGGYLCIAATLSYFAIPCFLMLTGAFIDKRIENIPIFYKKSFVKLGFPTLVFSVLYSIWYILLAAKGGNATAGLQNVAKYWKTGWLGHPLWYMYMLVGLYAIIPIVQKTVSETKTNTLAISIIFCIWSVISSYTSTATVTYNLGCDVMLLSYVIMGYAIKSTFNGKNKKIAIILIVSGILLLNVNGLLVHYCLQNDLNWRTWGNNFSPFVMLGSILIFAGFCKIEYTHDVKLAKYIFIIYLFHKGVLEVVQYIVSRGLPSEHTISVIFVVVVFEVILVFCVSLIFSIIYSKTLKLIKRNR